MNADIIFLAIFVLLFIGIIISAYRQRKKKIGIINNYFAILNMVDSLMKIAVQDQRVAKDLIRDTLSKGQLNIDGTCAENISKAVKSLEDGAEQAETVCSQLFELILAELKKHPSLTDLEIEIKRK